MDGAELAGVALVFISASVLCGYGLFLFVQASGVPAVVRIGVVLLAVGILVILLSVLRERIIDMLKESK